MESTMVGIQKFHCPLQMCYPCWLLRKWLSGLWLLQKYIIVSKIWKKLLFHLWKLYKLH